MASAPGVGPVTSAVIAGRIGDANRFTSLAAIRAYSGLVPKVNQSGVGETRPGITKAGDPLLREMLFTAADAARKTDPQLGAKYARLMATDRHRDSVLCHIATDLLTRIAACMRNGQRYTLRDLDGREITQAEGRAIVKEKYAVDSKVRMNTAKRRYTARRKATPERPATATGQESQKSQSAPTSQPVNHTVPAPISA